jgi:hypothetical protein
VKEEQVIRFCRYAALGSHKTMIYLFYNQIPTEETYAKYALRCAFPWRRYTFDKKTLPGTCSNAPRPRVGAVLLFMGRETRNSARRFGGSAQRFRVYTPKFRGFCPA